MYEIIKDAWDDGACGRTVLAIAVLCVLLMSLGTCGLIEEAAAWKQFRSAHACKIVGHVSASTQTGVGIGVTPNAQIGPVVTTSVTPGKTGWLCDDGVTYWR